MTGPGSGTVWLRIDHELVGRVLAERHRVRHEQRGIGDDFRVVRPRRRRVKGGVG